MSGFQFTFEVAGEQQLARSFSRMADEFSDFSEPFKTIADDFKQIESRQFGTEGVYGGNKWKPLDPKYARWKNRQYPGRPIMVRTGLLKESLMGQNPYYVEDIAPMLMQLGTRIPYAIYHQKGGRYLPKRELIQLNEADKTRWGKIVHVWMVKSIKKQFAGLMPTIGTGEQHLGNI